MPCPVCQNCDHDLRGGVLELSENVVANLKKAFQTFLDGMEAEGDGALQFSEALTDFATVRRQISMVMDTIPDVALIKRASAG